MKPTEPGHKPAAVTRYCPRCVQRPLERCSYAGHEVDLCPKCAGLWCDSAGWDAKVLGTYPTASDDTTPAPRPDRVCPNCRQPLAAVRVGGDAGCELDRCERCGGVWFDQGEWEHLECMRTVEAHQKDLERQTTWREWGFQFVMKLPIEFNVPARRTPVVTIAVIAVCTVVFLVQLAVGEARWEPFASHAVRVWRGEALYTLVTSNFLHASLLHLVGNMYFLYILGDNVEDALGRWRYALLYLGSAVASDLMYAAVFPGSDVPLVGASGGVFGVMAAYLLLYPKARLTVMLVVWQFKVSFWVWMGVYLALQVVGAILTLPGQTEGTAYWGHIGGFLAGLVFVWPQRRWLIRNNPLLRLLHRYPLPTDTDGP